MRSDISIVQKVGASVAFCAEFALAPFLSILASSADPTPETALRIRQAGADKPPPR